LNPAISLRRRLQFALLSVFALGIVAASSYFYFDTHGTHEAVRARTLQQQARELLAAGPPSPDGKRSATVPTGWTDHYATPGSGFQFTYYDLAGRVLATSANLNNRPPIPLTDAPDAGELFGRVHFVGPKAVPSLTVRVPGANMLLVVSRADPDAEALAESLFEERVEPIYVALPFGVTALILAMAIVGWSLRPLDRASREAARVGPSELSQRIATEGLPIEIRPLVDSFNSALGRLATAYETERRLTADAAHELRTPISILSLRLQRAKLDGGAVPWPVIEEDVGRLTRMVSRLLDLARRESGEASDAPRERVDLGRIVRAAAASLIPIAEARDRIIAVETPDDPVWVCGVSAELTEMVVNLIENAVLHGSGLVTVGIAPSSDESDVVKFVVADEGAGVPLELRDVVFDRFRKGSERASGSGLGLAIVRMIAETHGGRVECVSAKSGQFEVTLPCARSRSAASQLQ
jgi:two-component system, OmpR family, sensor histidine kinase TctE